MTQSLLALARRLWSHLSRRRRIQLGLVLVLMIGASFAEVVNIGALVPFLAALTSPDRILNEPHLRPFFEALGTSQPGQALMLFTGLFAVAIVVAGCMRLTLFWATTRLSYAIGADLSIEIYRRTLYQPYAVHVGRNSSEIIDAITSKTNVATVMITMLANFLGASFMMLAIVGTLLVIDPVVTLVAFTGFAAIYGGVLRLTRQRLRANSQSAARGSTLLIKVLQEGLGGIRDVILDGSQPVFLRIYHDADRPLRKALASSVFISMSPRFVVEALGMLLIAALAYALTRDPSSGGRAIPVLGALALGSQRALPILQQAYAAVTTMRAAQTSLGDIVDLLDQPLPGHTARGSAGSMPFKTSIQLKDVSFRYADEGAFVLKHLSFEIRRGTRIGIFGTTGTGKSTLLDIIMGLLTPTDGTLAVDGVAVTLENQRAWQSQIAHVPQAIFLTDGSVEENIAFGQPPAEIDHARVVAAAREAQINEAIDALPQGYRTAVGERGVKLSGGQRQRIGIARALYKRSNVIIFDEATSALDTETEDAVMSAIDRLGDNLTIIMVAHRVSTLRSCDIVVELDSGSVKRVGTFQEIFGHVAAIAG